MSAVCSHFGTCGGCTLQDLPPDTYRARKRGAVVQALRNVGIEADVAPIVAVAPRTRRRAVLNAAKRGGKVEVGFHPLRSHAIVDMHECLVLTPGLFALTAALRAALAPILADGQDAEVRATDADNGIDIAFRAEAKLTPALTVALAKAAGTLKAIRMTWNAKLAFESASPRVRLGKAEVRLPADAFLQASRDGEAALQTRVLEGIGKAKAVVDLFSGCGTFSLPLAERARVHAVERDDVMLGALAAAARATPGLRPVTTEKRDLFKLPVTARELARFDGAVLDPPRAGAEGQARELARSKVPRLAYVSCDAASLARDARILVDGGYKIGLVTPVDQFLWSSHIELVAAFGR